MSEFVHQMAPWIDEAEVEAMSTYLRSGAWLTEFGHTREFERRIADYVDSKHCSVLVNGTVTLYTAIIALGLGPGDEVLVPDFTMVATATSVVAAGATPVFVDVEEETLCMSMAEAEKKITPRTKAIMYVPLNGRSGDMLMWVEFAKAHNIALIEDAAQALGSFYSDKHLGTFGDLGSFSFSSLKIITTGQGGALATDSDELIAKIVKIRDFGRPASGLDEHVDFGLNFKFTDVQSVIGNEQMKKLPWRVQRKRQIMARYMHRLADVSQVRFTRTDLSQTSPWFIDIICEKRDELRQHLKENQIGARSFYPAVHSTKVFGQDGSYPVTEMLSANGLWIPSGSQLTDEEIDRVCDVITHFYRT